MKPLSRVTAVLALLVVGSLATVASAEENTAPLRLAIVCPGGQEQARNLMALVEVGLSDVSEFRLLERAEVARLLEEQELSLGGLVTAQTAVKAGRVLGVNVLLSLETEFVSGEVRELVAFDVQTGLRLLSLPLRSIKDPEKAVQAMVEGAQEAARRRLAAQTAKSPSVCVVAINNGDLPLKYDSICRGIHSLLERSLTHTDEVMLLERSRLAEVNRERALLGDAKQNRLLGSLLLVDAELSRTGTGTGARCTLRLTDATGEVVEQEVLELNEVDAAALAETILGRVRQWMKLAAPRAVVDRTAEANRFADMARFYRDAQRSLSALNAAEAALALDPNNPVLIRLLVNCITRYNAYSLNPQGFGRAAANMHRQIDLMERLVRLDPGTREKEEWGFFRYDEFLGKTASAVHPCPYERDEDPPGGIHPFSFDRRAKDAAYYLNLYRLLADDGKYAPEQIAEFAKIQERYRRLLIEHMQPKLTAAVHTPDDFARYTRWVCATLRYLPGICQTEQQFVDMTLRVLEPWAAMVDGYGTKGLLTIGDTTNYQQRFYLNARCTDVDAIIYHLWYCRKQTYYLDKDSHYTNIRDGQWNMSARPLAEYRPVFDKLAESTIPVIHLYGIVGQFVADLCGRRLTGDAIPAAFDKLRPEIHRAILASEHLQRRTASSTYRAALIAVEALQDEEDRRREYLALAEFMFAQKHLAYTVLYRVRMYADDFLPYVIRAQKISRTKGHKYMTPPQGTTSFIIENYQRYSRGRSLEAENAEPPWEKWTCLIDVEEHENLTNLSRVMFDNGKIYVAGFERNDALEIVKMPLYEILPAERKAELLYTFTWTAPAEKDESRTPLEAIPPDTLCAISDGLLAVADRGHSWILVADLPKQLGQWYDIGDGIPTGVLNAVVALNGKVYGSSASLNPVAGESYFFSIDPRAGKVNIIGSQNRRQGRSEFEKAGFHDISGNMLVPDPPRHRLLVLGAYVPPDSTGSYYQYRKQDYFIDTRTDGVRVATRKEANSLLTRDTRLASYLNRGPQSLVYRLREPRLEHAGRWWSATACLTPDERAIISYSRFFDPPRLIAPSTSRFPRPKTEPRRAMTINVVGDGRQILVGGEDKLVLLDLLSEAVPPPLPPSQEPLLHWTLDEVEQGKVSNAAGQNHHGRLHGSPTAVEGRVGGGLQFDGVDDSIVATGFKGVLGTSPRTVSLWIRVGEDAARGTIIHWGKDNPGQRWSLRINGQVGVGTMGALRVESCNGSTMGSTDLRDNQWHHVAVILPPGKTDVTDAVIYIDGQLEKASPVQSQSVNTHAGDDVTIGTDHQNRLLHGALDDIRIYNRALSAEELKTLATGDGKSR